MMFIDALTRNAHIKCFRVIDQNPKQINQNSSEPWNWEVEPMQKEILSIEDGVGLYILKALNILPDATTRECFLDMNLPERISDCAYFCEQGTLQFDYRYKFAGEIIPAVAIDYFGVYDQFYSRIAPEYGIEVLKRGLEVAERKYYIAEDLGYIFRDEGRFREAAEMFRISVDDVEGPSCYYIYAELADAYRQIGDEQNAKKYQKKFEGCSEGYNYWSS